MSWSRGGTLAAVLVVAAVVAGVSYATIPALDGTGTAGPRVVMGGPIYKVPYNSDGWRYKVVPTGTGAGFESGPEPAGFSDGTGAFGTNAQLCNYAVQTAWPINTDILVRRTINFPAGATGVELGLAIDNDALVYWNGELVGSQVHEFCATEDSLVVPIDDADVLVGDNLLAVRGTDRGDVNLLDIRVAAEEGGGCNLVGTTLVVRFAPPPFGGSVTIGRAGESIQVSGEGITDATCGGATVNNVDTIEVYGHPASEFETLTLDQTGGDLAPGATPEGTGISEIEVVFFDQGEAFDLLVLQGGVGNDTFTIGASGLNRNDDADGDDVTLVDIENVNFYGGGGKDDLSGAGGLGTGGPYASNLLLFGEAGADDLTGGTGDDLVVGGAGNDTFKALKTTDGADSFSGDMGTDTANYGGRKLNLNLTLDGDADDGELGEGDDLSMDTEKLTSGKGNDYLSDGDIVAKNTFKAGAGNDLIDAEDGVGGNDTADGGNGNDDCFTDAGDTELNCEA